MGDPAREGAGVIIAVSNVLSGRIVNTISKTPEGGASCLERAPMFARTSVKAPLFGRNF